MLFRSPQSQPQYEVADVLNKLGSKLEDLGLNSWQLRTLFALKKCRTSALGGHIDRDNRKDYEWKNNDLKLSLVFNL